MLRASWWWAALLPWHAGEAEAEEGVGSLPAPFTPSPHAPNSGLASSCFYHQEAAAGKDQWLQSLSKLDKFSRKLTRLCWNMGAWLDPWLSPLPWTDLDKAWLAEGRKRG